MQIRLDITADCISATKLSGILRMTARIAARICTSAAHCTMSRYTINEFRHHSRIEDAMPCLRRRSYRKRSLPASSGVHLRRSSGGNLASSAAMMSCELDLRHQGPDTFHNSKLHSSLFP